MSRYTVIIATHRRPAWLKRAVLSVKAQTFEGVDLIVVSDVVCEQTFAAIGPLLGAGDLFIQHRGQPGPAESRNIGIRLLASDYALFLDDDDEIPPSFVTDIEARRPAQFRGITYANFVFHKHQASGVAVETYSIAANDVEDIYVRNFIPNSCLVYPARLLKERRFDPALALNEDWDFVLNAKSGASMMHVPVDGPIIHKTPAPRRGNSNDHLLLDSYLAIYRKWPAPTKALKLKRKTMLAQNGIDVPLASL